ncbi:unnamed protein product [Caenorhabditis brenneri]
MKDPSKGVQEKSSKIQECLNRYSNSENRCIELAKHEAITYNSPHSMEEVESFLKTQSPKQLQDLKLHQREWRVQSLESQLRPGVIHFYLEDDFFTKPFTKMWDRTSKMVSNVASGITEKIKMMSVKCTNV